MFIDNIPYFLGEFFDFLDSPIWRAWPFNAGYGEHIGPAIARMAFVSMIFGAIILFLRILFGPKGFLREKQWDIDAEKLRKEERDEVERQFANEEIDEFEYKIKMKKIED